MCWIAGMRTLMNSQTYDHIKTELIPLWKGINEVDHNIKVTEDYCKYKVLNYDYYRNDPKCTIKYSETNMYINHYSWWFRNSGSIKYANLKVRDDFLKFITEYDFLQIIKDEIMQGKLQYPILEFDMYYAAVKLFMMLKKDFDNLDKLCNKPEGWEFTKSDEEYHRKKNKAKWEFEEVYCLPKPTNLPIQRDDVTVWDNRFGVIPIQQYEMDPHKIGLTDEQIVAMFNALKDSFLYDYAYSEYFKEHHSDLYDKMYKYYEKYILSDPTDYHSTASYRQAYDTPFLTSDEPNHYHDIVIGWINCMIEWELRRRFQPLIDRYWINGVDTLGLFSSKLSETIQSTLESSQPTQEAINANNDTQLETIQSTQAASSETTQPVPNTSQSSRSFTSPEELLQHIINKNAAKNNQAMAYNTTQPYVSPEELINYVTSKNATKYTVGYNNNPKGISSNPPLDPNQIVASSFHEAKDTTYDYVSDVKPSMALVEWLYKKEMMGTDESLYALCPNAFLAHRPRTREEYNRFVEKYITPIISEYLTIKPSRDTIAKVYNSQVYNIDHDIHFSDKYGIFFKQIDRAPFSNEINIVDAVDRGYKLDLGDGVQQPVYILEYKHQ